MSLKNMTLKEGGSTTPTFDGTSLVFSDDGITIANGVHLICTTDQEFQDRRAVTAKYRPPTTDPRTGQYGKDRKTMSLTRPMVLADGRVIFNTIRIEREVHPLLDNASAAEINRLAAQLLIGEDAANFWSTGALS